MKASLCRHIHHPLITPRSRFSVLPSQSPHTCRLAQKPLGSSCIRTSLRTISRIIHGDKQAEKRHLGARTSAQESSHSHIPGDASCHSLARRCGQLSAALTCCRPSLLTQAASLGLCTALAGQIRDWRRVPVHHALETLVRQRVFQITCGYEDQDDADTLHSDPLLKWVCGQQPERGADLASQPTLSRLENAVNARTCYWLAAALLAIYLQERERLSPERRPTHILLDLDGTDW